MNNEQIKILLVDDEPDILEFLGYNLKKEGYQIFTANNGEDGLKKAIKEKPQLIILDVMMPGMDGIDTCQEIKQIPELVNTIIVFLTARSEDYSQVAGYEAGADDYIAKPIKPKVLASKIKALLRRYSTVSVSIESADKVEIGGLMIDREQYNIVKNGEIHNMPKKEFELLLLLVSKPNKVFSREEIFAKVWDDDVVVGERTIDVHIRKIRERLQIDHIKTVKGVGYKFEI